VIKPTKFRFVRTLTNSSKSFKLAYKKRDNLTKKEGTKREESEEMWLRSKGFNIEFKSSKKVQGFGSDFAGLEIRREKNSSKNILPLNISSLEGILL
jgi:hypothetical protein